MATNISISSIECYWHARAVVAAAMLVGSMKFCVPAWTGSTIFQHFISTHLRTLAGMDGRGKCPWTVPTLLPR